MLTQIDGARSLRLVHWYRRGFESLPEQLQRRMAPIGGQAVLKTVLLETVRVRILHSPPNNQRQVPADAGVAPRGTV